MKQITLSFFNNSQINLYCFHYLDKFNNIDFLISSTKDFLKVDENNKSINITFKTINSLIN